jgi:hypothetical protein
VRAADGGRAADGPVVGTLTALRKPDLDPPTGDFELGRLDPAGLDGLDELDDIEITGEIDLRHAASRLGLLPPSAGRVPRNDNLKEIVGIGPMVEHRLRRLGITTFRQLATMTETAAAELARQLEGFGDRIETDDWIGQARALHLRHYRDEE